MPASKHRRKYYAKKKVANRTGYSGPPLEVANSSLDFARPAPRSDFAALGEVEHSNTELVARGWRRWSDIFEDLKTYRSRKSAQDHAFRLVQEAGLTPYVVNDEDDDEDDDLEVGIRCPHGVEGDTVTLSCTSHNPPVWEQDELSWSDQHCELCRIF